MASSRLLKLGGRNFFKRIIMKPQSLGILKVCLKQQTGPDNLPGVSFSSKKQHYPSQPIPIFRFPSFLLHYIQTMYLPDEPVLLLLNQLQTITWGGQQQEIQQTESGTLKVDSDETRSLNKNL